jgi:predicted HTH domain antitoxin
MTVNLPSNLPNARSSEWVSLHFAIGLYVSHEATLKQAAEVAGLSQKQFQQELAARKLPVEPSNEETQSGSVPIDIVDSEAVQRLRKFQEKLGAIWAGSNLEFTTDQIVQNLRESRE